VDVDESGSRSKTEEQQQTKLEVIFVKKKLTFCNIISPCQLHYYNAVSVNYTNELQSWQVSAFGDLNHNLNNCAEISRVFTKYAHNCNRQTCSLFIELFANVSTSVMGFLGLADSQLMHILNIS